MKKMIGFSLVLALATGACKKDEGAETEEKVESAKVADEAPAPKKELKPKEDKKPAKPKKIDPADLPPKLAKVYEATKGVKSKAGGFVDFHKAVIAKHGEPTFEKELYGKPAYFWAAREGDLCVQFGYPSPKDPKATMWSTWQPSIYQPPAKGLSHGDKYFAEKNWDECTSYAAGKAPTK